MPFKNKKTIQSHQYVIRQVELDCKPYLGFPGCKSPAVLKVLGESISRVVTLLRHLWDPEALKNPKRSHCLYPS